jgi:hypothetical protein
MVGKSQRMQPTIPIPVSTLRRETTTKLKRLYGVVHGGSVSTVFGDFAIRMRPNPEMLAHLSECPKGTRIAVEWFDPALEAEITGLGKKGLTCGFSKDSGYYWHSVIDHCKSHDLAVVYLENREDFIAQASLARKVFQLEEKRGKKPVDALITARKLHSLRVEQEYTNSILREPSLINNLINATPEVGIMGVGHTVMIAQKLERNELPNLEVEVHLAEADLNFNLPGDQVYESIFQVSGLSGAHARRAIGETLGDMVQPGKLTSMPNTYLLFANRKRLERQYKAAKTGRITGGQPNFIGTWDTKIPSRGLFEFFIVKQDGEMVSGTIEDTFGSATFNGRLTDRAVTFTKLYDDDAKSVGGSKSSLRYQSTGRVGNKFVGDITNGTGERIGIFEMKVVEKT